MCVVQVSVYDTDLGRKKGDLIGEYNFDMSYVYFQENHEMYRQWVGISDPIDNGDKGLQGYLKLSITVIGPGDKQFVHDPAKEVWSV